MSVVPNRPSPRAALFGLARALPDVAFDAAVRMTRAARYTSNAVLDTVSRPAHVQAGLQALTSALEPSRTRGEAERRREVVRVSAVAKQGAEVVVVTAMSVVERVPLDPLLDAIDLNALLERLDLNGVLEHVDLNRLLANVDMEALLQRIDVDAIVSRVDVEQIIERVDIDAIINRVDIDAMMTRLDIAGIVRQSTTGIGGEARDGARSAAAHGDVLVARVADFFLRRKQRNLELKSQPSTDVVPT
jgi:hypothetical protein